MAKPISHGAFIATMVAGVSGAHLLFIAATVPAMGKRLFPPATLFNSAKRPSRAGIPIDPEKSSALCVRPRHRILPEYSPSESDPLAKTGTSSIETSASGTLT